MTATVTDVLFQLAAEGRMVEDPETGDVRTAAEIIERMIGSDDRAAVSVEKPDGSAEVRLFVAGEEVGDVMYRVAEEQAEGPPENNPFCPLAGGEEAEED